MELTPRLRLMNWLVSQGLTGLPENDLIRGFCERCRAEGLELSRGLVLIDTLHPIFEGHGFRWNDTETNESDTFEYGSTNEGDAAQNRRRSIFYHMLEHGYDELAIDLADCASLDFPMIDDLAAKGHKHFVAFVHRFGEAGAMGLMDCVYSYWLTRRDEGSASKAWRRCETWCRCWGWPSNPRRRSASRERWAGSISGATPRSRCCAGASRAASPSASRPCCGFPTCAVRLRSAKASNRTRSSRFSTIMRRPPSTPSTMPAARCSS